MHFLLIIAHDDEFKPTEDLIGDIVKWISNMQASGVRVDGNPLRPASEAITLRVREGQVVHTPGPFSRSREQMCAYELLECATFEIALEAASKHPMAAVATIEVRPVWTTLSKH
ncbi:MAG: transcription initiation protein [Hydrogenophaga sp.]|uniref:YciI family protein n=1 Tax=Hydrogenophaga sp. TaxID=1904254 RepID=UPI0026227007|nr:YciI family protein [Hydrogenophaga sp.]MCW5672534.1 transcription initiation protein [Hydrogenophaga sp.]